MTKKTICIDFDGVIHAYSKGYHDGTIYDPPSEGTWDAMKELAETYKLVVLSARARTPEMTKQIGDYLKTYDLAQFVTNITNIKPAALWYIDDRAIRFESWEDTTNRVDKEYECCWDCGTRSTSPPLAGR